MGFFDRLFNAFNKLFGETPKIKFDDNDIVASILNCPQSLSDSYKMSLTEIMENIHQVYSAANNKEFTIGIIGDFTVGKSSFVNAILGDRILPVSANPTTAVITKIKYGRKPKVVVRYKDGSEEEMTYEAFLEFSTFNLNDFQDRMTEGDIRRFKNVVYAVMYVKSDFLKDNNLCIVDTLGLSEHESDNKKTIASIRDAIAIVFLCAESGLSDKNMDFISSYLNPDKDDFFVCINRIDLVKKSERTNLSQLVKLKLDNILSIAGHRKEFPSSKIYQVSSLYQEFANGFTDHEDWHEGVNYQELSGFMQIMSDVCKYVNVNANISRREAINTQLQKTRIQLTELMELRKSELDSLISTNTSKILSLNKEIKNNQETIASVNLSFEKLFNEISSFSNNLFDEFYQSVNNEWEEKLKKSLLDQVSFGVGDYLALQGEMLLSLIPYAFKSSTDYHPLEKSLSPFVNLTIQFLEDQLQPILYHLELQIKSTIEKFINENNYNDYFDNVIYFNCNDSHVVKQSECLYTIYRAVAIAATESTWMSNRTRRIKMFNAAKTESLKYVEKPLNNMLQDTFVRIKKDLDDCNAKVTTENSKIIEAYTFKMKELELENASLKEQKEHELLYFNSLIASISIV